MKQRNLNLLAWMALFAVYFIWEAIYLAGAFALSGFPALYHFGYPISGGWSAVISCTCVQKDQFPGKKYWAVLAISGTLMLCAGSGLGTVGEQYISSGSAAVIIAMEHLFFTLMDRSRWEEYLRISG